MKELIKRLLKYKGLILLIFVTLFIQAFSDLALPDYMARIVNVGINQGGIENTLPDVISEDTFNKIKLLSKDEEFNKIEDIYSLADKEDLKRLKEKTFKDLDTGKKIYLLKDQSVKDNEELQVIISKSITIKNFIDKGIPEIMKKELKDKNMASIPKGEEAYKLLALMGNNKSMVIDKIHESFSSMPNNLIVSSGMKSLGEEYESLGISAREIQNSYMFKVGITMILIALVSLAASILVGFIASRIAADFGRDLRRDTFNKVMTFSNREFDKFSTASLITRSNNDIQQVQNMLVMLLRILFFAPILGIGGIVKAMRSNVGMAWIIALAVIVISGIVLIIFSFAMPLFKRVQKEVDKLQLITREILNGLLVIRAFVTGKHEEERFNKANKKLTDTNQSIANVMVTLNPILMLLMNTTMLVIIWVGAKEVVEGNLQVGNIMAFLQYAMQIIMSFLMITMVSIMLPRASISLNRVSEVLKEEATITDRMDTVKLPSRIKGDIEFRNVSFRFENAPENALSGINLKIKSGEITAFIGSTGSGKSTLVNLIPRFYDVTEGSILIDGYDIRDIAIKDLRDKIGFVPQKAILFTGTIDSNMKIGKNVKIEDERVDKALELAQASEFVSKSSEGKNKEIAQGGTNVSGGQRQRLSIARAIAGKPEIYIFDDSFSALDFKTDYLVRKALKAESENSTVIIVAQRIGTILNADKIVVLDNGVIVGEGTHRELMKNCSVYQQIASSQISMEA